MGVPNKAGNGITRLTTNSAIRAGTSRISIQSETARPVKRRLPKPPDSSTTKFYPKQSLEWYDQVENNHRYSRRDLQNLKYLLTLIRSAREESRPASVYQNQKAENIENDRCLATGETSEQTLIQKRPQMVRHSVQQAAVFARRPTGLKIPIHPYQKRKRRCCKRLVKR